GEDGGRLGPGLALPVEVEADSAVKVEERDVDGERARGAVVVGKVDVEHGARERVPRTHGLERFPVARLDLLEGALPAPVLEHACLLPRPRTILARVPRGGKSAGG